MDPLLAPTKTRFAHHRVALDQATADALDGFHDDEMSRGRGSRIISSSPLVNSVSDRWLPNHATKLFIRYRNEAESSLSSGSMISGTSWATQMLDAGVPVAVVAGRLGSRLRASTTLNVYAHVVPGGDRLAAEVLRSRLTTGSPSSKL